MTREFAVVIAFASVASGVAICQESAEKCGERLWERSIAAKGGRERVLGVRTLFQQITMRYRDTPRRPTVYFDKLYVLPDRLWEWDDQRGTVFGLRATITHLGKGYFRINVPGVGPTGPRPATSASAYDVALGPVLYLMETHWAQTKAPRCRPGGARGTQIIEVDVDGHRVDYHVDQQTHLPARVETYSWDPKEPRDKPWYQFKFSDYRLVDGVMMPHKVIEDRGSLVFHYNARYELNPAVDPNFFERPPPAEDADRYAWRASAEPR